MDKFRRVRKPSPTQKKPSATSSSPSARASSSTKITIEQKVPIGAVKKGPYSVKRSVGPNDVVIKRRFGEGSKPLFSRADIAVNPSISPKKQSPSRASSSDSSSSEEHIRHKVRSSKPPTSKAKSVEKVPYFLDQKREKDRIKRVYGQSRSSRSLSAERRRRAAKIRSRSRTPPSYHRRHRSYGERRSSSRDRDRNRDHYRSRHRSGYSRSRSRSRERARTSYSRRNGSVDERTLMPPTAQFIPIPVPVEYPYMPPAWGAPIIPPPGRYPFLMRPALPPPIPYMPRQFRPPRYIPRMPNGFQRGSFRPRQY